MKPDWNNINWNNLEVKEFNSLELMEIRRKSYWRYPGPNEHFLWLVLGLFLITPSILFFVVHMNWFLFSEIGEFPKYHKTEFWIGEILSILLGSFFIYIFSKKDKKAKIRWKEMESIRDKIDKELESR